MASNIGSFSFILGYLLIILGDGCLLVAATVAASSGGSPIKWGTAFGLAHGMFTLVGLFIASTIASGSEILGHLVVLFALAYLLRHFLQHRSHKGNCGCLHHSSAPNSFILGISFAFSIHAVASGAVLQQAFSGATPFGYLALAVCSAVLCGSLISMVVRFSEEYRSFLIKFFNSAPSVTTALLSAAILYVVVDLVLEFVDVHFISHSVISGFAAIGGAVIGIWSRNVFKREVKSSLSVPSQLVSIRRNGAV